MAHRAALIATGLLLALPAAAHAGSWTPQPLPSKPADPATGHPGYAGGVPSGWPDGYDTDRYPDSASCQEALNAALRAVLAEIYNIPASTTAAEHAFARTLDAAIKAQADAIAALRPICLRKPATAPAKARSASRGRFVRAALPLARGIIPLAGNIRRRARQPGRLKPLVSSLLRRADKAAETFDLGKLSKASTWARCTRGAATCPGVSLRKGQLKALPGFASDLNKISGYEKVMVELHEEKYAADAGYRANVDHASRLQNEGRTYAQLEPREKADIASQFQKESGAFSVLLRWARNVGKSATGVVFGR